MDEFKDIISASDISGWIKISHISNISAGVSFVGTILSDTISTGKWYYLIFIVCCRPSCISTRTRSSIIWSTKRILGISYSRTCNISSKISSIHRAYLINPEYIDIEGINVFLSSGKIGAAGISYNIIKSGESCRYIFYDSEYIILGEPSCSRSERINKRIIQ